MQPPESTKPDLMNRYTPPTNHKARPNKEIYTPRTPSTDIYTASGTPTSHETRPNKGYTPPELQVLIFTRFQAPPTSHETRPNKRIYTPRRRIYIPNGCTDTSSRPRHKTQWPDIHHRWAHMHPQQTTKPDPMNGYTPPVDAHGSTRIRRDGHRSTQTAAE